MKKLKNIFLAFILCLNMLNFSTEFTYKKLYANAKAETTTYAKALVGCVLYKSQLLSPNLDNIYFIVPETYFVSILEQISDVCLKVQYKKYIGYVDASTITIATFIPIVKTLENIKIDIKETSGTQVWSIPSTSGNVYTTISAGTKNIDYIAMCYGSIPSGGESNLWYYVSFTPESNSTNVYEGYVYSENVTNLTNIVSNTETNPESIIEDNDDSNTIFLPESLKSVIIIVLIIPCVCLLFIVLFKIASIGKRKKNFDDMADYEPQQNNSKHNLEESIGYFSRNKFVKKTKDKGLNYPDFPEYDSDDELL